MKPSPDDTTTRAVGGEPKLVFRTGPCRGKVLAIDQDRLTIGRDRRAEVVIEDDIISSRHAVIGRTVTGEGSAAEVTYWIEDLGSKNGTFVNGKRIRRVTLQDGDVFCLCQTGPEIEFTRGDVKLPSLFATSTQTLVRTRSIESAVRELLPSRSKTSRGVVSATGVREIVGAQLEESSRKSRRAVLVVGGGVAAAVLVGFALVAIVLLKGGGPGGSTPSDLSVAGVSGVSSTADIRLEFDLRPVFSSLYHSYREDGIGSVRVLNAGDATLENTQLTFDFAGEGANFLVEDIRVQVPPLAPSGSQSIEIRPLLSRQTVTDSSFEVTAVARLRDRTGRVLQERTRAVTVHDYHAFNWRKPERVSVFIDSSDEAVAAFVDTAWKSRPVFSASEFPPSNVVGAVTLLTALSQRGIHYKPDAQTPVSVDSNWKARDRVNYPGETLLRGTGDCDDLVVLCCSILENVGIPTAVVVGDGHVFLMFDTGLKADAYPDDAGGEGGVSQVALLNPESRVEIDGRIWLPIEATELAGSNPSFVHAWTAAWHFKSAIEARDGVVVVPVRAAWEKYKALARESFPDVARRIRDPETWRQDDLGPAVQLAIVEVRDHARARIEAYVAGLAEEYEGLGLAQATAFAYATSGLYDVAVSKLEAAIFSEPVPKTVDAIRAWSGKVTRNMAYLLNDLAIAVTLAAEGQDGLGRAVEYYKLALGALPADIPEVGEMMLRLGLVHRLRGELVEADRWIEKALRADPELQHTYEALQRGDGAVAGIEGKDARFRDALLKGLGVRRL